MLYAIIIDNKIDTIIDSSETLTKLRKAYGDIRLIDSNLVQHAGTDARAIDWTTQTVKSLSQQIAEGIVTVPDGSILEGEIIRPMSHVERINAGLDTVPDGWKIAGDHLEPMTLTERYDAGQITAAQYNTSIRTERRVRYAMDSDPLYMEYLYDAESKRDTASAKKQAWIAKIDEIKAALPLKAGE